MPRTINIHVQGNSNMDEDAYVTWLVKRLKYIRDRHGFGDEVIERADGRNVDADLITVAIQEVLP